MSGQGAPLRPYIDMPITAADWKRLSPLLDAALDLAPAERSAWLATLPPEHADLRDSLAEMLAKPTISSIGCLSSARRPRRSP